MKPNKNNAKKAFFLVIVFVVFVALLLQASSEEIEKVKYTDLEKEEVGNEGNEALKEYYGDLLGYAKENARFNNIATKDDIAVLNVTIDGKDKRILTRLSKGAVVSKAQEIFDAIRANNITVLENLKVFGKQIYSAVASFGERNFYSVESSSPRYVDEGFSRLVNGKANVSINPVLRELISSYNVFLSAEGLTKGIYVAEKTNAYFIVKSANANSNVGFSWMLRGAKKDFDEKLASEFGKEKGIGITAEINFENGVTKVKITGANKILGLINFSANNPRNNSVINETNNAQKSKISGTNSIGNQSQGIELITGKLVDEFGLETDLGKILGEAAPLPNLSETTEAPVTAITEENITPAAGGNASGLGNAISNETTAGLNETSSLPGSSVLEFTLYSTNEEFIISQVADVTSLSLSQVKKLINFVYLEPVNFEDEAIEPDAGKIDGIEKVNGSVIIRLG